jgi:hypothetical protein
LFTKKQRKDQLTDLSLLPPCKTALLRRIDRANYVAKLWKEAGTAMVEAPEPAHHGWNMDGDIDWVENVYPEDITKLLCDDDNDDDEDDDDYYGDEESDSDSDDEDLG